MPRQRPPVRIAVIGAGLAGQQHIKAIARAAPAAKLSAVADTDSAARALAENAGAEWYPSLDALLDNAKPDGILLATPNELHPEQARKTLAAGLPTLIEKPVATTARAAASIARASEESGTAALVGHYRRHHPAVAAAREKIQSGALGEIVSVHAFFWLKKPDDYFKQKWRARPGGGPVFINLSHDIDIVRHLCGEVVAAHAFEANHVRGNAVEESAAISLRFAGGALGTVTASDVIPAPWSWELTARENPVYPPTGQSAIYIGGTRGSLELPRGRLWRYARRGDGWWHPLSADWRAERRDNDLLRRQICHFADVIRGESAPLVSAREGMRTLQVLEAIKKSARTGRVVKIDPK
ncbi:MAG: Gfo/Idh/MocA family oxidoreductase [Alphaproteobacteria bacterium]|nr:Gfo/Idh/MocA family oxidoreductase [Alphaproteobacteria bacterium]MDA8004903.1 Gfo/Idh/MocA family oxidoreductase [Alphaproteobacteria bacterium]MDA8005536.1 Gfo/Idh/MocA family oxidoreductase [Alphaproteobacteria bacterium]MDA8012986.1 Gfo/Idh/MocA family oxidoreductase [Alphaproteobacteria bacterium]